MAQNFSIQIHVAKPIFSYRNALSLSFSLTLTCLYLAIRNVKLSWQLKITCTQLFENWVIICRLINSRMCAGVMAIKDAQRKMNRMIYLEWTRMKFKSIYNRGFYLMLRNSLKFIYTHEIWVKIDIFPLNAWFYLVHLQSNALFGCMTEN